MGIKPYMFAPAVNTIVGQRLCRRLCTCATRRPTDYAQDQQIKESIQNIKHIRPKLEINYDGTIMTPAGCKECNGTGYKWRVAIIEILNISTALRQFILENKGSLDIYAKAREEGFLTFQEDGLIKILQGLTTLDELRRVV
jgi:type IV pilus assembly protein PilB